MCWSPSPRQQQGDVSSLLVLTLQGRAFLYCGRRGVLFADWHLVRVRCGWDVRDRRPMGDVLYGGYA